MRSSRRISYPGLLGILALLLVVVISFAGQQIGGALATSPSNPSALHAAAASNTAVTTYKDDYARTGNHATETILNTSNVNQNDFGRRVTYPVDGQVYTQPLYLPNVTIGGSGHNVVYVATETNSVYAFDADQTSASTPLWHTSFLNPPAVVAPTNTDLSCNDMVPYDGLSGTPVIDRATNTLYVVALTKENGAFVYHLHALDVTTGKEKPGSPIQIQASVAGTGAGSVGGKVSFNPQTERQRTGLIFANGMVYIGWGSFCDNDPYHGWIMSYSYNGSQLQQTGVYNDTPNSTRGGIWGSGGAISADSNGNIYYVSGNGGFDGKTAFGDSFVRLNAQLKEQDYFSPFNQQCLNAEDADLGSGGPLLLPNQDRIISSGKEGRIYVLNTTKMGGYNTITNPCSNQSRTNVDKVVQELPPSTIGGLYSNATYWSDSNGHQYVYFAGANDNAKMFSLSSNGTLSTTPLSRTPQSFGFTGGNPTVSSNGGAPGTGIVWTLDPTPALRAYDATNLGHELWSSTQNSSHDGLDTYVKFSPPTVANGEVFVGSKTSLNIFGLLSTSPTPSPTTTSSATPTPTTTNTPTPTPTPGNFDNAGISNDNQTTTANLDGKGYSFSAEALGADGIIPGGTVTANGFQYTWPSVNAGTYDNYQSAGQQLAITPVSQADHLGVLGVAVNGSASGTATITYTDNSTQSFTLGFSDWAASKVSFGNYVVAAMTYRNKQAGQQALAVYLFSASVALQSGKTVKSLTLPSQVTGGQLHIFAAGTSSLIAPVYNNVGITDDGTISLGFDSDNGTIGPGNIDGMNNTLSAQALQAAGIVPGNSVTANGITYAWPDVAASEADNYQAGGQQLAITPVSQADHLGVLGVAVNGSASGTATITYTDNSTQSFTLGFSDWAASKVSFGNYVVAAMTYRNTKGGGLQKIQVHLFSASVALQSGKTVKSLTLPSQVTGGQLHIFAAGTSSLIAPVYNNVGITNNGSVASGNFDGGGRSYSAQALQAAGLNAGDNAFDPTRTVVFTWPAVPAGTPENYQSSGQVIPVTPAPNATLLAFLGASSGGPASGTATITYTDNTTQTFTLGLSDWTLGAGKQTPSFGNAISYTSTYRSNPTAPKGQELVKTYVFYASVNLQAGKTMASVKLPSTVSGGNLHVFAVTTK